MLLDEALRSTLRNFSTIFLVVFTVLGPLHVLYGFAFHDVLALRELHDAIAEFPASRQVRGVGRDALTQARVWFWVLALVEILLLPLFLRAVASVLADERRGNVPTAIGAWKGIREKAPTVARTSGSRTLTVVGGLLMGTAVAALTEATLMVLADLLPDSAAFGAIALAQSVGRSAGGAFLLVAVAVALESRRSATVEELPDLY